MCSAPRRSHSFPKGDEGNPGTQNAADAAQHDRVLQDGQVADAPRSAFLHAGTTCPTLGTHDVVDSAFEMSLQLLGAESLMDDAEFWETEQRFETMEVHEHGFLLLAG
jgi:hypothetical protein